MWFARNEKSDNLSALSQPRQTVILQKKELHHYDIIFLRAFVSLWQEPFNG